MCLKLYFLASTALNEACESDTQFSGTDFAGTCNGGICVWIWLDLYQSKAIVIQVRKKIMQNVINVPSHTLKLSV